MSIENRNAANDVEKIQARPFTPPTHSADGGRRNERSRSSTSVRTIRRMQALAATPCLTVVDDRRVNGVEGAAFKNAAQADEGPVEQ